MNQKNLWGPILLRFAFFVLNIFFAVRITSTAGWNFFSILLAFFAARDFVQAVRLTQVYYHIQKRTQNDNDDK